MLNYEANTSNFTKNTRVERLATLKKRLQKNPIMLLALRYVCEKCPPRGTREAMLCDRYNSTPSHSLLKSKKCQY